MLQYGSFAPPHPQPAGRTSRLAKFLGQSLRAVSGQVACGRSALWVFDGSEGARTLRCLRSHDALTNEIQPGMADGIADGAQQLFDALCREGHVVGGPQGGHEALGALAEHETPGGAAPMAAAFSLNGQLLGALVCSRPISGVAWSQRQVITLTKASASVALSLSRDGDAALQALLERPDVPA